MVADGSSNFPPKIAAVQGAKSPAASVEDLLTFERMLAELSARFANVPAEQVETEIKEAQMMLQQFLGCDRTCLSEFQEDGSLVVLSSTAADGVDPTPVGQLPTQLKWFFSKLRTGKLFVISNGGVDLPPEAAAEADFCQRTGLVSHLAIPLRVGGRVIGDIAFSVCRGNRTWPEDLTTRLKLVGEVFAQALARRREQEKFLKALAEIKVLKDRLEQENTYLQEIAQVRPGGGICSSSVDFGAANSR